MNLEEDKEITALQIIEMLRPYHITDQASIVKQLVKKVVEDLRRAEYEATLNIESSLKEKGEILDAIRCFQSTELES
jgi:hypothetical protein